MMYCRYYCLVIILAVALAGCTMGLGENLDPRLVQTFKLQQVSVSVPTDAKFWWAEGELAYAQSIGRAETSGLAETPEARNYMRNLASQRIKTAFDRELGGRLTGTRPVRLDLVMDDIYISSPIQQALLGAAFRMHGSARLVDAKTGQVIATNPNLTTSAGGAGGIVGTMLDRAAAGEPIDRLATNLAESYRGWLLVN